MRVDGAPAPKRHRVAAARRSRSTTRPRPRRRRAPTPRRAPFAVAYEDEHLLVVDKPAGVVVHPARGHRTGTLAQALAGRAPAARSAERPGSSTAWTATPPACSSSRAARRGAPRAARPRSPRREIDARVPRARRRAARRRAAARSTRRSAATAAHRTRHVDRHRRAARGRHALRGRARAARRRRCCGSACETGRTHQIRVHLQAIGHPVVRRPRVRRRAGRLGLERQFLHAARLAFAHPVDRRRRRRRLAAPGRPARALARAEGGEDRRRTADVRAEPPEVGEGRPARNHPKRRSDAELA